MSSNGKSTISGDPRSEKTKGVEADSFPGPIINTGPIIQTVKTGVSSGVRGKAAVSSGAKGKAIVSAKSGEVMFFKDVKFGPHEGELRFRLIHFWEARNVRTKILIGLEMLLIDQEVIKGEYGAL